MVGEKRANNVGIDVTEREREEKSGTDPMQCDT